MERVLSRFLNASETMNASSTGPDLTRIWATKAADSKGMSCERIAPGLRAEAKKVRLPRGELIGYMLLESSESAERRGAKRLDRPGYAWPR